MGIKIKNEAGGQWHGLVQLFEGNKGDNDQAGRTMVQEVITCVLFNKYYKEGAWFKVNDTSKDNLNAMINGMNSEIDEAFNDMAKLDAKYKKDEFRNMVNEPKWQKSWMYQLMSWDKWAGPNGFDPTSYVYVHHDLNENNRNTIAGVVKELSNKYGCDKDLFQKADIYAVSKNKAGKFGSTMIKEAPTMDDGYELFKQAIDDHAFIGISLKQLTGLQTPKIIDCRTAEHLEKIVPKGEIKVSGIDKIFDADVNAFKNANHEGDDIQKSTAIHFELFDVLGDGTNIKRHLQLRVGSGSWHGCQLKIELGKDGDAENADTKEKIKVPNAALGNVSTFIGGFMAKDDKNNPLKRTFTEEFNEFTTRPNGIYTNLCKGIKLKTPLIDIEKYNSNVKFRDMNDQQTWYAMMTKLLRAYNAMDKAIADIMTNDDEARSAGAGAFMIAIKIFMLKVYYAAKGSDNNSACTPAPYLYLGN